MGTPLIESYSGLQPVQHTPVLFLPEGPLPCRTRFRGSPLFFEPHVLLDFFILFILFDDNLETLSPTSLRSGSRPGRVRPVLTR